MRWSDRPVCGIATLLLSACNATTSLPNPAPYLTAHPGQTVHVWLTSGHVRVVYDAHVTTDSLLGNAGDSTVVPVRRPNTPVAIALTDVRQITVTQPSAAGSAALFVVLLGAALVALLAATWHSGPMI